MIAFVSMALAGTLDPTWTDPCSAWGQGNREFGAITAVWDEEYEPPTQVAFCEGAAPCPQWYPVNARTAEEPGRNKVRTGETLVRVRRRYQSGGTWKVAEHEGLPDFPLCFGDVVSTWWGVSVRIQRYDYGGQGFVTLEGGSGIRLGDPSTILSGAVTMFLPTQEELAAKVCHAQWGPPGSEATACSNNTIFRVELSDSTGLAADVAVGQGPDVKDARFPSENPVDRPHELEVRDGRGQVLTSVQAGRAVRVTNAVALPVEDPGGTSGRTDALLQRIDVERERMAATIASSPTTVVPRPGVEESRRYRLLLEGRAVPLLVLVDGAALPQWAWTDAWNKEFRESIRASRPILLGPGPHTVEVWSPARRRNEAPTLDRVTVGGDAVEDVEVARAERRKAWEFGAGVGGVQYHVTYESPIDGDSTISGRVEGYETLPFLEGAVRYHPPVGPHWWVGGDARLCAYANGFSPTTLAVLSAGLSRTGALNFEIGLGGGAISTPRLRSSPGLDGQGELADPTFTPSESFGLALSGVADTGGRSPPRAGASRLFVRIDGNVYTAITPLTGWAELRPGLVYRTGAFEFEAAALLSLGTMGLSPLIDEHALVTGTGITGGGRWDF